MEEEVSENDRVGTPVGFSWRILAALCLITSALVVLTAFGLVESYRSIFTEMYGDKPLPQLTMVFISHGYWIKCVTEIVLLGIVIWMLISKKSLPFFYAGIALIFSNLLLISMVTSVFMPLVIDILEA